jgi:hypothetical protein
MKDHEKPYKRGKAASMPNQHIELEKYDEMVSNALNRLTKWAFPDSRVERKDRLVWQLWHTTDDGKKYIDVSVELQVKHAKAVQFYIGDSIQGQTAELTREDLDDALRIAICSLPESAA